MYVKSTFLFIGIYQLGPTSQHAVKEGEVDKPYDTRFVFSEVNADVNKVIVQPDGRKVSGETNRTKVGAFLCTKAVGSDSYVSVTSDYKYAEGTPVLLCHMKKFDKFIDL